MDGLNKARRNLPHFLVALVSIVSLCLIALAHRMMPAQASYFLEKIIHSLHGPGFIGVAFFVFALLRLYHRGLRNYVYAAGLAFSVGVLSEAAQIPGPRDAEVGDLVIDAIGIFSALGMLALIDPDVRYRLKTGARIGLAVTTVLALAVSLAPTAWYSYSWIAQQRALPQLLSFEQPWERQIVRSIRRAKTDRIDAPADWPVNGNVLRVTSSGRGGLLEIRPYPNWSQPEALSFLASPDDGQTRSMGVLLTDSPLRDNEDANRYRVFVQIGPGPTRIRIPLNTVRASGQIDVANVERMFLFLEERVSGVTVIFDDFRLEP